jgi:hypothetical protein
VTASVIVVLDEVRDLGFKITGQVVVLAQNAVLERLVPALNLALGLGMAWRTANMGKPPSFNHSARSLEMQLDPLSLSGGLCATLALWQPDAANASSSLSMMAARIVPTQMI